MDNIKIELWHKIMDFCESSLFLNQPSNLLYNATDHPPQGPKPGVSLVFRVYYYFALFTNITEI